MAAIMALVLRLVALQLALAAVGTPSAVASPFQAPLADKPWMNPKLAPDARTALLLSAMTLDEKVAQLSYGECGSVDKLLADHPLGVGGCGTQGNASQLIQWRNEANTRLANSTRLGIPVSIYGETTHSGGVLGATVFPMPCAQGSSWNFSLVEEIAAANALELRSAGGDQALSPILQVCTDPRFGRMEENFGEDPFLVAECGRAAVTGLQGPGGLGAPSTYLDDVKTKVASQAKHFALYGAGSKDGYTPMGGGPGPRATFEVYLRPWRDFGLAGGRGVMASHNMVDMVPVHANHRALTGVLRNRFGLGQGYIGSDNTNVEGIFTYFNFAANATDAGVMAMQAGVDQDMPGGVYLTLADTVRSGILNQSFVDRAASNILRKKFASGLFDAPLTPAAGASVVGSHRELARRASAESMVLLVNGNTTLPMDDLDPARDRVLVVGPFGDGPEACEAMLGGYSAGHPTGGVTTVAAAFRAEGFDVAYVQGSDGGRGGPGVPPAGSGVEAAVAAVANASVVVVAVGTMACSCCDRCGNGEVGDRNSLDLEGGQLPLLEAVLNASAAHSKRAVVALVHGRPVTFGSGNGVLAPPAHFALLSTWRSGVEGGPAMVDVIRGRTNPSGRLAQNWVRHAGFVHSPTNPWFQTHSSMTHGDYFPNGDGAPSSPLFPFGFGLSYTSFAFSNFRVGLAPAPVNGKAMANASIPATITVKNTGALDGAVPVLVTFAKLTRGKMRYLRMMCASTKVHVGAGQTAEVALSIALPSLARYDEEQPWVDLEGNAVRGAYVVDNGSYDFFAGDCVNNGGVWDDSKLCTSQHASLALGTRSDGLWGVFL